MRKPMSFNDDYHVYAFCGDPDTTPIWHWHQWQKIAPQLEALLAECRGLGGIRCLQYTPNGEELKFGRLQWSEKNNGKWTHGSPNSLANDSTLFLNMEMWVPSANQCQKENSPPDVYLMINNEGNDAALENLSFNPLFLLVIKKDIAQKHGALVSALTQAIKVTTQPKLLAFQERIWTAHKLKTGERTNAINDIGVTGIFKPGKKTHMPVSAQNLEGDWETLT
jgi:hypothetical protein